MKVVKNKVAPPFRVAEFDIDYGRGISKVGGVLDVAVQAGAVKRGGAYFAYGSERLGQGRPKAKAFLEGRPELVEAIVEEVIADTAGDVPEAPLSLGLAV
jgi:recombination protein RecA